MLHTLFAPRAAIVYGGVLALALTGCGGSDNPLHPEDTELASLRQAVEPFHDFAAANGAGYDVLVTHPVNHRLCLRDPALGAMGIHYLNGALVDDTVLVDEPEVLIYEPEEDGSLEFVGVEYVIPFTIRGEDQPPPVLFGRQFKRNHVFNLWALHAWVGRDNPSGTFADWNPDVTCEHIGAVTE